VFGFVKQSNGEITVTSEVGKGTTFNLYFPCGDGSEHPSLPPSQSPILARATETVLLVEDDDQVRAVAKAMLERGGYTVLDAASCGEALSWCQQKEGRIDVLLTDVVMPGMSGRILAEQVRGGRPGMKVVFMSGYTDDGVVREGATTAGIAFVQKPLSVTRLLGTLREVLQAAS
jgi:DNA-binding NtrC family response regulator